MYWIHTRVYIGQVITFAEYNTSTATLTTLTTTRCSGFQRSDRPTHSGHSGQYSRHHHPTGVAR